MICTNFRLIDVSIIEKISIYFRSVNIYVYLHHDYMMNKLKHKDKTHIMASVLNYTKTVLHDNPVRHMHLI